jgi:hypothetical protein
VKRHHLAAVGAGVVLAASVSSVAYAIALSPSVTSNTTDVVRRTTQAKHLSTTGGTQLTLLSATLPAGSWVVTSELTAVDFFAGDFVRCNLQAGTTTIGAATTTVGGANTAVADIVVMGAIKSSSGFSLTVKCAHDQNTPSGSLPPYFDARAVLWAHKSPVLSIATQ